MKALRVGEATMSRVKKKPQRRQQQQQAAEAVAGRELHAVESLEILGHGYHYRFCQVNR